MLETYFSTAKMLGHLRSGPSGRYLDGFAAALEQQGYGPETAVRYLRAAAHVGHVMAEQGASLADIDLAAFSEHLRTCRCPRAKGGRRNHHTIYGARLFRRHLIEIGVCPPAVAVAAHVEPQVVTDFKTWLRKHRGASDATIRLYARDAAGLMTALVSDPPCWRPNDIRSYFLARASKSGRGTIEKMTTSLRAFLRYFAVAGRCQAGLDGAVPAYAHWQLADMPRYLSAEQVDRFTDGVWWIELAPMTEPREVVSELATLLGVKLEQDRPAVDLIAQRLGDERTNRRQPLGRSIAQPCRPTGQCGPVTQHPEQIDCSFGVGRVRAFVGRRGRPRLPVHPVALGAENAVPAEVDDVALQVDPVGNDVQFRNVHRIQYLGETRGRWNEG